MSRFIFTKGFGPLSHMKEVGKPDNLNHKFRVFDDDGILYAEGYTDDSSSFKPLDYAMADWGCTEIKYLEGEEWETL